MATFREFLRAAEITVKDKTSAKRSKEILEVLRRYHITEGMTPEKAVRILEALGPTYVKLGQIASNRSDILPTEYCKAFEKLHADVSPLPFSVVVNAIEESYGMPVGTVFARIDEKPLGSASIAQVHKAQLLDGSVVAVKVRRPGIAQQMAEDITLMRHLLAVAELATTSYEDLKLNLEGFLKELQRTTANEVDFSIELGNLERFSKEIADDPGISSPKAYPEYSTDAVLVMEYVEGINIDHVDELRQQGADIQELSQRLTQNYISQVLDCGFFQADPHPGNILVKDGTIIWIDLGMTGQLTGAQRSQVEAMMRSVVTNNPYRLKDAVLGLCEAHGTIDHGKLLATLERLLNQYGNADLSEINIGSILEEMMEILRNQSLILDSSVTMLVRGVVTLEGVVANLAGGTNIMEIVARHVIKDELSWKGIERHLREAATSSLESAQAATRLPMVVLETLEAANQGELEMRGIVRIEDNALATLYAICGRISLALISVGLFLGSSLLCTTDMQPKILEVPILGVLGYLGAFVLGVYVIYEVFRSRHRMRNNLKID